MNKEKRNRLRSMAKAWLLGDAAVEAIAARKEWDALPFKVAREEMVNLTEDDNKPFSEHLSDEDFNKVMFALLKFVRKSITLTKQIEEYLEVAAKEEPKEEGDG